MKNLILLMSLFAHTSLFAQEKTLELGLSSFKQLGNVNWSVEKDEISASTGTGFLVSTEAYDNFQLKLEFFAGKGTNSGVFFRCVKPETISDQTCYEVNIFDTRPEQIYRTGGIVSYTPPLMKIDTEDGKWHQYEIEMRNQTIKVKLDGKEIILYTNDQYKNAGPIALQFVQGLIKFRKISLTKLDSAIAGVTENLLTVENQKSIKLDKASKVIVKSQKQWETFFAQHTQVFDSQMNKIPAPLLPVDFSKHQVLILSDGPSSGCSTLQIDKIEKDKKGLKIHYTFSQGVGPSLAVITYPNAIIRLPLNSGKISYQRKQGIISCEIR